MKRQHLLFSLCAAMAWSVAGATAALHVSPDGDDANPGTAEKPLKTPEGARDAVRRLRTANGGQLPAGGVEVVFADGVYRLARTLVLTKQDTGAEGTPVVWRAAHRGQVVWSGDLKPSAWGRVKDPETLARLPAAARGHVVEVAFPEGTELPGFTGGGCGTSEKITDYPISVFQDGERLGLARWPKDGFAHTGRNLASVEHARTTVFSKTESTSGRFEVGADAARLAAWAREPDLWAFGLWNYQWADAATRITAVKPEARELDVDVAPIGFGVKVGAMYYVFNALCELDEPGRWAVDRARRRLYVWPRTSGTLRFAFVPTLVSARKVSHVRFEGLVFEYARRVAVEFRDAVKCAVVASSVRHTSSWAIQIENGRDCRVAGCDLFDLGRGGIALRGGDIPTLASGNNVADNNHIGHYGKVVYNYQPAIALGGVGNRAVHNLIHHSDHQAISFGGNDHYIGWNVIHDMCMHNDDAGSIYCCQRDWTRRGTVIERNLIHMTGDQPRCAHVNGIYLDDFSSGVTIRGNLINRAALGIYLGGGQDNVLDGNIVMNCPSGIELGSRGLDSFAKALSSQGRASDIYRKLDSQRTVAENDLWRTRYPNLLKVDGVKDPVFAHNALWNVITNNVLVGCGGIGKRNWEAVGPHTTLGDNLELADDPGFADYFGMDWSLKPGSAAAAKVGPTGFEKMGLYASDERFSPPVKFGDALTPPRKFGFEYAPATIGVHLCYRDPLPSGLDGIAYGLSGCDLPDWGKRAGLVSSFGKAPRDSWRRCSFSFTPRIDCKLSICTMGARGEKTLYDDFRAEGAVIANGSFEQEKGGWAKPSMNPKDYRAPICNTSAPWGFIDEATAGVPAADGRRMACGNDMINFYQTIEVKKDVPVTISFSARAFPIK